MAPYTPQTCSDSLRKQRQGGMLPFLSEMKPAQGESERKLKKQVHMSIPALPLEC